MVNISPFTPQLGVRLRSILCTHTQVRTHVKIWPIHHNKNRRECYLDNQQVPYTERHNMTEFLNGSKDKKRKPWMRIKAKEQDTGSSKYVLSDDWTSDPVQAKETAQSRLKRLNDSLRCRGSARESQPYQPPSDVVERILKICAEVLDKPSNIKSVDVEQTDINTDLSLKLKLIDRCIYEFGHELPSSVLVEMNTVGDLVKFYSTPVRGVNPYTDLLNRSSQLPQNLHIIRDPILYDREKDDFFGGQNAYPGAVMSVGGIRGSRLYPTRNQDEFQWPDI